MKGPADGRGSRVGKALVQLSGLVALLALRLSHKAHVGACGWGAGQVRGKAHPSWQLLVARRGRAATTHAYSKGQLPLE